MEHEEDIIETHTPIEDGRVSSPYPALQSILPRLAALNPNHEPRPVFEERGKADLYIDVEAEDGDQLMLIPVWSIDHNDLRSSGIQAWSFTRHPC